MLDLKSCLLSRQEANTNQVRRNPNLIGSSVIGMCGRKVFLDRENGVDIPVGISMRGHGVESVVLDLLKDKYDITHTGNEQLELVVADTIVVHPDGILDGKIPIDIKSTSAKNFSLKGHHKAQAILQSHAMNAPFSLMFYVDPADYENYLEVRIDADEAWANRLVDKAKMWKACFDMGVEPEATPGDSCSFCDYRSTCSAIRVDTIEIEDMKELLDKYVEVNGYVKAYEKELKGLKQRINDQMGLLGYNRVDAGDHHALISEAARQSFDAKSFASDYPDLYQKYLKETRYARLTVK